MKSPGALAAILFILISSGSLIGAPTPNWVGTATHTWTPRLGGGVWYQPYNHLAELGPVLAGYPRPVLIGLRSDRQENGYRFDKDAFNDPGPRDASGHIIGPEKLSPYHWWVQRASH